MTAPPRPLYLDEVFGVYHAATGGSPKAAVLLCPPWGWDDVASYRARREWAEELAAAGHAAFRFDFPGTGDSAGSPADPARVKVSTDAVVAAAAWLRAESGAPRIAAIGLGLGGLLAAGAIADGAAIDDLVLWGSSERGRGFVRQERAFSQMQTSRYSLTGEPEPQVLPPGWMEAGGFILSAETIGALSGIDLGTIATGRLARALLLDRDGIAMDARVTDHLVESGVEVTSASGRGWAAMCFHPEHYRVPTEVIGTVTAWLGAVSTATEPMATAPPIAAESMEFDTDGGRVRETGLVIDLPVGPRFAVLAEPADASRSGISGVFLNAGAVRRIGPNRMWVDTARRWAVRGVPTLRVDLAAIGDSDGDGTRYRDVGRFFATELEEEVVALIDEAVRRGLGDRVVLGGLCAGGYWSFHGAARDPRVIAALMMNPRILVWDDELLSRRDALAVVRLRNASAWRQLLRGEVTLKRTRAILRALLLHAPRWARRLPSTLRSGRRRWIGPDADALLATLRERNTRVLMAFSGDEPLYDELERDGYLARLDEWPNMEIHSLPGRDHTFRPIVVQRAVREQLDRELTRVLEGVPATRRGA